MSELIRILLLYFLGGWTIMAFLVTLLYLLPNFVNRTSIVVQTLSGRALALGFVNTVVFVGIIMVLLQIASNVGSFIEGLFSLAAFFLALILVGTASIGMASTLKLMRQRLADEQDEKISWRTTLRASLLFVSALLAPFIGWFILLPLTMMVGLGAVIIALAQGLTRFRQSQ